MSNDDKDDGGVVLGGISFGVGSPAAPKDKTASSGPGASGPSASSPSASSPSASSGASESMALLPMRVVAVASLLPEGEFNAGANAPEQAIRVEPGEFDELFRRLAPRLSIQVDSVLTGGIARIEFAPRNMKSFRPDGLASEIPLLRSLLDGKKVLERLRDSALDVSGATSELNRLWNGSSFVGKVLGGVEVKAQGSAPSPAAAPQAEGGADIDRILDMVDLGTSSDADSVSSATPAPAAAPPPKEKASGAKGQLDAFISAVAKSGNRPGANPDQGIRTIEKAVGLQLGAIVQHPEFRRLEEAWRGLNFLVSRSPKEGVRLEVMSANANDTPDALRNAFQSGVGMEPPVTFAVADVTIAGDGASLARMRAIADVAEEFTVPVFANGSPQLFGKSHLDDIDRLDNKAALFEAPERAPWRTEAHRPSASWLSLALNRVVARKAYDKRTSRIREATVEELPAGDGAAVWMSPAWAVATLPILSFDKFGWPCRITGAPKGGIIEDLPVHEVPSGYDGSDKVAVPTEAFFSTETQRALGRIGLLALAAQPNSDACYLLSASTAYVTPPKRTYDSDTTEPELRLPKTPLGDQLFVARLVQFLRHLGRRLPSTGVPSEVEAVVHKALWELFDNASPPGPELEVKVDASDEGLSVMLTIRPRNYLGVQMEEISLGVPMG